MITRLCAFLISPGTQGNRSEGCYQITGQSPLLCPIPNAAQIEPSGREQLIRPGTGLSVGETGQSSPNLAISLLCCLGESLISCLKFSGYALDNHNADATTRASSLRRSRPLFDSAYVADQRTHHSLMAPKHPVPNIASIIYYNRQLSARSIVSETSLPKML